MVEGGPTKLERSREALFHHQLTNRLRLPSTTRTRQDTGSPLHVIGVEVAADDHRSCKCSCFFERRTELFEPFLWINARIKVSVDDTNGAGLRIRGRNQSQALASTKHEVHVFEEP